MALQAFKHWLAPLWDPMTCLELPVTEEFPQHAEALLNRLEIQLRQKLKYAMAGERQSLLRGHGLEFSQLRPYMPGDDIRKIDWNVFARTLTPFIKEYQEEKQLTLWLVVDLTPSMFFGQHRTKASLALELAGLLGLLAHRGGHRLGLYCFNGVEKAILSPANGYAHLQRGVKFLLDQYQKSRGQVLKTEPELFQSLCQEIDHLLPKQVTVFFLSDFLSPMVGWENALGELSRRAALVNFWVEDPVEQALPQGVGLLSCFEPESQQTVLLDTQDPKQQAAYQRAFQAQQEALRKRLSKTGTVIALLTTEKPLDILLSATAGGRMMG